MGELNKLKCQDVNLLLEVFIKNYKNNPNKLIFIKNITDDKELFTSENLEIKNKLNLFSESFFDALLKYMEFIKYSQSDINILKNNEIKNHICSRNLLIGKKFFQIRKNILEIGEKSMLILDLQNVSHYTKHIQNLQQEATKDVLTGLINRRAFIAKFYIERNIHERYKKPMSFVLLDIDKFKNVNDKFGHDFGDEVLKAFAKVVLHSIRDSEILARIGGEEFVVLLPLTNSKTALNVARRIRENVEVYMKNFHNKVSITSSFGVSSHDFRESTIDFEVIYKKADNALYLAKDKGRNRVEFFK